MAISRDLFLSILSMDAYNRSYNAGISGLGGLGSTIGHATLVTDSETIPETSGTGQAASFYGLAYKLTQPVRTPGNLIAAETTILSCRGTDQRA
jgi:hypothetical protein